MSKNHYGWLRGWTSSFYAMSFIVTVPRHVCFVMQCAHFQDCVRAYGNFRKECILLLLEQPLVKKNCEFLRDEAQPRRRDVTAWNESPRVRGMLVSVGQASTGAAAIGRTVCEQTGSVNRSAGTQQVAEGGRAVVVDRTLSCPYRYSSSSILVCFIIMSAAFFPSMKLSGRCPQARMPYL